MKSTIHIDQQGRIHIKSEKQAVTVIPSDFDEQEIAQEVSAFHTGSGTTDSFDDWTSIISILRSL